MTIPAVPPPPAEADGHVGGGSKISCSGCGASLVWEAGVEQLQCPYCGATTSVSLHERGSENEGELDLDAELARMGQDAGFASIRSVKCGSCGATVSFSETDQAKECPYCATPMSAEPEMRDMVRPQWLLPFKVARDAALQSFRDWVRGLWFAPNDLKRLARPDTGLQGIYIPHYTFDANTRSRYIGERGTRHTRTVGNGQNRRTETYTTWSPASGQVSRNFDDMLVPATTSLPRGKLAALEPWGLEHLVAYDDRVLAGYRAELPGVDLREADAEARSRMEDVIRQDVRAAIGGDEQRIHSLDVQWSGRKFKLILLPVWTSAYRYKNKAFQFLVNARTGEVQGFRPWSVWKIAAAASAGTGLVVGILKWMGAF